MLLSLGWMEQALGLTTGYALMSQRREQLLPMATTPDTLGQGPEPNKHTYFLVSVPG